MDYTLGPQISANPYHVSLVRGKLTRSIPELLPTLYEEMVESFNRYIPATDGLPLSCPLRFTHLKSQIDWSSIKLYDTAANVIAQVSNRVIVGLPLCACFTLHLMWANFLTSFCGLGRNPEWLKLNIRFTTDVVLTGFMLSLFPTFMRPWVGLCRSCFSQSHLSWILLKAYQFLLLTNATTPPRSI